MKKVIRKSKFKIKKLSHWSVINKTEIIDEETIVKKFNQFFGNIGQKLASKIPLWNTHFEQYVKYDGTILERKEICHEELKNAFPSFVIREHGCWCFIKCNKEWKKYLTF